MPPLLFWLPYAIVVGTLVAIVAMATDRALSALQRPARHAWLAALWLAPALALLLPHVTHAPAVRTAVTIAPRDDTPPAIRDGTPSRPGALRHLASTGDDLATIAARAQRPLGIAWAAASGLLLAGIAAALGRTMRRAARSPHVIVSGHDVHLDDALGPAAVPGRPGRIVVPRWALDLEPALLALLVRHEHEHLRARDPWALVAALLAVAVVPWSPAAWWMCRRHRLAVEVDCDRRTLGTASATRARYASLLLLAAGRPRVPRPAGTIVVPAMASHLARRITMLTSPPPSARRGVVVATALALVATTLGFTLPHPRVADAPPAEIVGVYLFTSPDVPRARMLAPDREFTYLRLAADGRSRYENVTVEVDGPQVAPRVDTTPWSSTPWRVEPATAGAPSRLCWELPMRAVQCATFRRDARTGDLTLQEPGGKATILRRVAR